MSGLQERIAGLLRCLFARKGRVQSTDYRRTLGQKGEERALRYLKRRGYRHLESNFAVRGGEIDLIVQQGRTIVFVEVKTRETDAYASGEAAVNSTKRKKIEKAARHFIRAYKLHDSPCRFDIMALTWPTGGACEIRHYENAFRAHARG